MELGGYYGETRRRPGTMALNGKAKGGAVSLQSTLNNTRL
jgi:hypothetical protein